MARSLTEELTEQFYAWEKRGRGWQLWNEPVVLEPPYTPFIRYRGGWEPPEDDGRKPFFVERLWRWAWEGRRVLRREVDAPLCIDDPDVEVDAGKRELTELQVRVPAETGMTPELAEQILLCLTARSSRVSFELVGSVDGIVLQFVSPEKTGLRESLEAFVPGLEFADEPVLGPALAPDGWSESTVVVDFGLSSEFMLPLVSRRSFTVDPLTAFVAAMNELGPGDVGVLQVLFEPVGPGWAVSALRAISDGEGRAFFTDAPQTLALAREKLSRPLLACVLRIAARGGDEARAWEIAKRIGGALGTYAEPTSNELMPLDNEGYPDDVHLEDLLTRRSRRSGMLLSSGELAGIVHLPGPSVRAEGLRGESRTTKAAPSSLHAGDVLLGQNAHRGSVSPVWFRTPDRLRHMHVVGATGTGKSTLLLNLIRQDLEAGRGVGLLDPHGDLAEEMLGLVPEARAEETVFFDPSDEEHPVGFNVLRARSDRERDQLSSDLVAIFRRFSASWGDQMTAVLGNALQALLLAEKPGTLLDLRRFLLQSEARKEVLSTVDDPLVLSFWRDEFSRLSGARSQLPIVNRLDAFLRPRAIRHIVAQGDGRLDVGEVMDRGGVFVGKLSQGAIGEENAHLLGSLLVAKFQQVAMARERIPERDRRPFILYIDEFHHFATPSLTALLSGARKYGLGLVLAHQELKQLSDHELKSAVLTNAATRVVFRVGDEDARALASGFRAFNADDLMSQGIGEAVCRVGQADQDFNLRCAPRVSVDEEVLRGRQEVIRTRSRERYAGDRAVVEAAIAAAWGPRPEAKPEEPTSRESLERAPAPAPPSPQPKLAEVPTPRATESPSPARNRKLVTAPASPGRGGPEHKYLQSLIKSYGESKGWRATIEAPAGEACGIDVLLVRGERKIACEISLTTSPEHEVGNVRKCLEESVELVAVISPSPAGLKKIEEHVKAALAPDLLARIRCFAPAEFIAFLDEEGPPPEPEHKTVLGYKVKTKIKAPSPADAARSQSVTRTIVDALRRIRR